MSACFTDHFLIAMPGLGDPHFAQGVVYICAHNDQGALGIIVNRPLEIRLGEVLNHLDLPAPEGVAEQAVFYGGPVEVERGFVLHRPAGAVPHSLVTPAGMALTTSREVLQAIAEGRGPERFLVALGYAGWAPGQLESELADNAWLCGPASEEVVFELPPEARLEAAAAALGVDLSRLSNDVGHA